MSERRVPGLDLEDCCFGSCSLGLADFGHAIRHEPRTQALLRWATGAGALGLALGTWLLTTPRYRVGLAACAFGVLCFAAHQAPDQAAARWFAKLPKEARTVRYTLSSTGLIVVSDVARQVYPWRSLEAFHQAPEALLVWVTGHSFLILPTRAFAPEVLPRVVTRLSRELGPPPALSPFWIGLVSAAVVCLGLLWLWNWLAPR